MASTWPNGSSSTAGEYLRHMSPCMTRQHVPHVTLHHMSPCMTRHHASHVTMHDSSPCITCHPGSHATMHDSQPCITCHPASHATKNCMLSCIKRHLPSLYITLHHTSTCITRHHASHVILSPERMLCTSLLKKNQLNACILVTRFLPCSCLDRGWSPRALDTCHMGPPFHH